MDGECKAKFSKIISAVEAVDYEINQMGAIANGSARDNADWRNEKPNEHLIQALSQLIPPRKARTISDALGYLCFTQHNTQKK
jgi:hypothetical protein